MPLDIAVAQPLCVSYDVARNALTHAAAIRETKARVIVFPELSLTGYELDASSIAVEDPRLRPIANACAETGTVALVGAPVEDRHIAMLAFNSEPEIVYRKVNLGTAEAQWFKPGEVPAVLEVDGWRLGLAICKDTGIPRHSYDTAALGMDVYVAAIVEDSRIADERAHRIATDHQVYVAIASFAGPTGGGFAETVGRSSIRTPEGVVIVRAGAETGEIVRAQLDCGVGLVNPDEVGHDAHSRTDARGCNSSV